MRLFPVAGLGEFDDEDFFGTFYAKEAAKLGVAQRNTYHASLEGIENIEPLQSQEKGPKTEYILADGAH